MRSRCSRSDDLTLDDLKRLREEIMPKVEAM